MVENKRKRGRPKKEQCRVYTAKYMVTKMENDEIDEFARACGMSKSDFIRDAVREKITSIRSKYGLKKTADEAYYDDFDSFDELDEFI